MTAKRWRNQWVVDFINSSGKRIRRVSPVQTKRGAEQFEHELRLQLEAGHDPGSAVRGSSTSTPSSQTTEVADASEPEQGPSPRFDEFAVEWLRSYVVPNLKPSAVVNRESTLRVHLIPFFGNLRLDEITPRLIEAYKAEKLERGRAQHAKVQGPQLSPKSVNNHLAILRKLLATAEEWELLDRVPKVRKLRAAPGAFDWLTAEESARFLAAVEEHYPQWRTLFWIALRTGMRRGEIFGLEWDAVDLDARIVTVNHSVYRGRLDAPKSGKSRAIPMTARLAQVISEHRAASMMKSRFLFPGDDGKAPRHLDHVDRPLHGALKRAGLRRIRFHDLRHSFASQLVSAGRPLKEVQELLGHGSMTMTMRYAHLAPERMRDAVEVLEAAPETKRRGLVALPGGGT